MGSGGLCAGADWRDMGEGSGWQQGVGGGGGAAAGAAEPGGDAALTGKDAEATGAGEAAKNVRA